MNPRRQEQTEALPGRNGAGSAGAPVPPIAWAVLATGSAVVFGALGLARFGYGMVLPAMQSSLGLSNTQTGILATANLSGYMVLTVAAGAVASRFGSRMVVTLGLLVAAAGMLLTGLAGGMASLVAWRAVTGAASGCINVPTVGLMPTWFPRRSGFSIGIVAGGQSLGLVVAGIAVPRLVGYLGAEGWRACWYLFAGITLVLVAVAFAFLRNHPGDRPFARRKPPARGGQPCAAADQTEKGAMTGCSADAAPGRATAKLGFARTYRSGRVWHLGFVYIAFGFSYIIYLTYFTKRLVTDLDYSPEAAGNLFMLMGWCGLLSGLLWGSISDRLGRGRTLAIVYAAHCLAFGVFALWPAPPAVIVSTVLFGLTAWGVPVIMAAACSDLLGPRMCPAGLGFITLFFGLGQAVGPSVAGALADATGSFQAAFLVAAGLALAGSLGSLALRPGRPVEAG